MCDCFDEPNKQKNSGEQLDQVDDPSFLTVIISKLKPECIGQIDHEIENAILSILTQVIRNDDSNKKTIGKMFIKEIAGQRLDNLIEYSLFKAKQIFEKDKQCIKKYKINELASQQKISDNILFTDKNETKFFNFITTLVKNSDENLTSLKKIRKSLEDYLLLINQPYLTKYQREVDMAQNK